MGSNLSTIKPNSNEIKCIQKAKSESIFPSDLVPLSLMPFRKHPIDTETAEHHFGRPKNLESGCEEMEFLFKETANVNHEINQKRQGLEIDFDIFSLDTFTRIEEISLNSKSMMVIPVANTKKNSVFNTLTFEVLQSNLQKGLQINLLRRHHQRQLCIVDKTQRVWDHKPNREFKPGMSLWDDVL